MAQRQGEVGLDIRFSHVAVGVLDLDRSLEFIECPNAAGSPPN